MEGLPSAPTGTFIAPANVEVAVVEVTVRVPVENVVEVALVVVELPMFKREAVEEAVERKPFRKPSVVEVDTP